MCVYSVEKMICKLKGHKYKAIKIEKNVLYPHSVSITYHCSRCHNEYIYTNEKAKNLYQNYSPIIGT